MIGTLGFAPPEQYQGVADPRSDIYSLGATLHYVLTGRDPEKFPPFSFPPVRDLRPELSTQPGWRDRSRARLRDGRAARDDAGIPRHAALWPRPRHHGRAGQFKERYGRPRDCHDPAQCEAAAQPSCAGGSCAGAPGRKRRAIGMFAFMAVMTGLAFGATYIYSDTALQSQMGLTELINNLPWKHEELVAKAREHPLSFERMTLMLSTRSGSPLSPPKASFTDTELANARYLKWDASFRNGLAGLDGHDDHVEARFYDPSNVQIASSDDQRFVGPNETTTDFSGVALLPDTTTLVPGSYKIALYSNDQLLGEQSFNVSKDLAAEAAAAKAKTEADAEAAAAEAKRKAEVERLAMIQEKMRRPLQLKGIEFVNSTKDGTVISGPNNVFSVSKVLFIGWRATFAISSMVWTIANTASTPPISAPTAVRWAALTMCRTSSRIRKRRPSPAASAIRPAGPFCPAVHRQLLSERAIFRAAQVHRRRRCSGTLRRRSWQRKRDTGQQFNRARNANPRHRHHRWHQWP